MIVSGVRGLKMKHSCRECGEKFSTEEIATAKNICPKCGKETSWFSDPVFFSNEE